MPVVLPDATISTRRTLYRCCYGELAYRYLTAVQYAKDAECLEDLMRRMLHVRWALSVVNRTPLSTEDADCMCVSSETACVVIRGADTLCVSCGCGCAVTTGSSATDPCAVVITYTVLGVVDVFDLPPAPSVGDQYLVWQNGGVYIPAYIALWDGASWQSTLLTDGQVVSAPGPVLWTSYAGVAGMLYPTITVSYTGFAGQYNAVSDHPAIAASSGRNIQIEATSDGTTWSVVYTGAESDIDTSLLFSTFPLVLNPVAFKVRYYTDQCNFGYQTATLNNTPPFSMIFMGDSVGVGVDNSIYSGQLFDPQPFPVVDTSTSTSPTPLLRRIRRNDSVQGSGCIVAVGTGGIIRRSLDEGATWAAPGGNWESNPLLALLPRPLWNLTSLAWATEAGSTVACCGPTWCVFISTDAGNTFTYVDVSSIINPEPSQEFTSIALYSSQEFLLGSRNAIWRTTNGGTTFTKVLSTGPDLGEPCQINHMVLMGDVVVAWVQGSTLSGVVRSTDRGASFVPSINTASNGSNQDADVFVAPGGPYHLFTGFGEYSDDTGVTWRPIQPGFTSGVTVAALSSQMVAYMNISGGTLGMYLSMDGGLTNSLFYPAPLPTPLWGLDGVLF